MPRSVLIGTSGFGYREWKGKFYPRDLPPADYLRYYAERFPTTEVNSSFYRMPTEKSLMEWAKDVPKTFVFSFKAPQIITHFRRLRNVKPLVRRFDEVTSVLGKQRGVLNFQTPPNLKVDLPLLEDFLAVLPKTDCSLEFRHPSWFTGDVRKRLKKAKRALCFNDADVEGCPRWPDLSWGMWKLRRVDYAKKEFAAIVSSVKADSARKLLVYFKHEERATGPKWAKELRTKVNGIFR